MAIVKKEAYFRSSNGVNNIRTLIWADDEAEPVAVFQIAHGVCEHIERYDDFARFLADKGFVVCGNDHLGHGKSVESEADLGYTGETEGYRRFVDDMHILYNIMHRRYPELPYFLFGHSMGSFCARVYASTFGADLAGLIICGTGQLPAGLGFSIDSLQKLVDRFGARTVNHTLAGLLNRSASLMVPNKKTKLDWLSYNEANVQAYIADPLCGFEMPLSLVRDTAAIGILASETMWPVTVPTALPILIISGAEDPVGFKGRGPLACSDSLAATGHDKLEMILYPHCRHEILNEDCREKVYFDVLGWLNSVLF